ncbi:hypothetical protein ACI792_16070 [Blastococcus sp. SYSU DS0669]
MSATTARGAAHDVPVTRLLGRTCAAEWTRLWTVRSTWWFLLAAAIAMVGLGAVLGGEAASDPGGLRGEPAWMVSTFTAMPAQFALLGLAALAVTADYATGGIVPALQWTPRRAVLLLARTAVVVAAATLAGVLLGVVSALAARAVAGPGLTLPLDAGLDALGTLALVVAAGAALATGLGFLLRSTAGVLVSVFLLMLVLPLLLPQFGYDWTTTAAQWLPGSGAAFLLLGEAQGMTRGSSVTVLVTWATAAVVVGGLRLVRDDAHR